MLGKLTRQQKSNCGLDFPTTDRGPLVVTGKFRRFGCNALEKYRSRTSS
uniref:Uncharacterized protein n=1 Tax=Ciona savignyi TaxID=51511 RepID=H2YBL2_CIOSA